MRCVRAYQTDADRQCESKDVVYWPYREDPRTIMLLPAFLQGLAAKIRFYCCPEVGGFTATVRSMYTFVKAKKYPSWWWLRSFALALPRVGVQPACLSRQLRIVLGVAMSALLAKRAP